MCTTLDYDSGDEYSGYTMSYIFDKWGVHIPNGPSEITFLKNWGPGAVAESINFDSGLRKDGTVERGLAVATIVGKKIFVLEVAPRSFSRFGF